MGYCHTGFPAYTVPVKQIILSLCLVMPALGAEKPDRIKLNPTSKAAPHRSTQSNGAGRKAEPARTVKLEFEIKDEGGQAFLVLVRSSGGEYSINRSHLGPDNEHSWDFNGSVEGVTDSKKVEFTYLASELIKDINEDAEISFGVKGSAVLKANQQTVLGFMGDRVLSVTATVVE